MNKPTYQIWACMLRKAIIRKQREFRMRLGHEMPNDYGRLDWRERIPKKLSRFVPKGTLHLSGKPFIRENLEPDKPE